MNNNSQNLAAELYNEIVTSREVYLAYIAELNKLMAGKVATTTEEREALSIQALNAIAI